MDGARVAGAAMRLRERRPRSWAKHERMTVAMALAENLHHSRQKVEGGEHDGPRAQKTARATVGRPGVLTEPEPQEGAVTVGYAAGPGPLLVVASLAGGDEVDATTVSYLLKAALVKKKKEEEKERKRLERRPHLPPSRAGRRGRRRGRSAFLALVVFLEVLLVVMHLALCFLPSSSGLRCSALWPIWTRRTVMQLVSCLVGAGFARDPAPRAVFPLFLGSAGPLSSC